MMPNILSGVCSGFATTSSSVNHRRFCILDLCNAQSTMNIQDVAMNDKPLAFDAYEAIAERFAVLATSNAYNACYERPATLSLLGDVRGKRVLDAGCGPGIYAEWLLD